MLQKETLLVYCKRSQVFTCKWENVQISTKLQSPTNQHNIPRKFKVQKKNYIEITENRWKKEKLETQ